MVRRRRHGFTLIEILVVIGIILLLIGIGVIGYQHIDKVAAERSTRANLEICSTMLSEYQTNVGTLKALEGPSGVYITSGLPSATVSAVTPTDVNLGAYDRYSQQNPPRSGSRNMMVFDTASVLQMMSRVPAVKSTLTGLPPKTLLPSNNGNSVQWLDSDNTPEPATATLTWTPPVTVIVDAWKNPIIYVPTGGLTGVLVNVGSPQQRTVTITSVDGRPFWASAGQDGIFRNGDDNIYSTAVRIK